MTTSRVISILNEKGGVGKTTTVVELSFHLGSQCSNPCLIIDLDPQADATDMITGTKEHSGGIFDLLTDDKSKLTVAQFIQPGSEAWPGVFIIPADRRLAVIETHWANRVSRDTILKRVLSQVKDHFSYVVLDLPPAINNVTTNALVASDGYLIPTDISGFSKKNLGTVLELADMIRDSGLNPHLAFLGIVMTGFQKGGSLAVRKLVQDFSTLYGNKFLSVRVPDSVKVTESQHLYKPVGAIDPDGAVSRAYIELTNALRG